MPEIPFDPMNPQFKFAIGQKVFVRGTNKIVEVRLRREIPEAGDREPMYIVDPKTNGKFVFAESELTAD